MKVLVQGKVEAIAADYEVKVDGGKLVIEAKADLLALVDKAAEAVPGQSPMETIIVGLVKQGVAAL